MLAFHEGACFLAECPDRDNKAGWQASLCALERYDTPTVFTLVLLLVFFWSLEPFGRQTFRDDTPRAWRVDQAKLFPRAGTNVLAAREWRDLMTYLTTCDILAFSPEYDTKARVRDETALDTVGLPNLTDSLVQLVDHLGDDLLVHLSAPRLLRTLHRLSSRTTALFLEEGWGWEKTHSKPPKAPPINAGLVVNRLRIIKCWILANLGRMSRFSRPLVALVGEYLPWWKHVSLDDAHLQLIDWVV